MLINDKLDEIISKNAVDEWAKRYTRNITNYICSIIRKSLDQPQEKIEDWLTHVVEQISAEGKSSERLRTSLAISMESFND